MKKDDETGLLKNLWLHTMQQTSNSMTIDHSFYMSSDLEIYLQELISATHLIRCKKKNSEISICLNIQG